jgi:phosphatidylinositol-3-phosphatase
LKTTAVVLAAVALLGCRAARSAVAPIPNFDHIVVVVFENKEIDGVLGNRDAPTFNLYGRVYARITQSYGVTHPSLPNYIALVSGGTWGITTNCNDCSVKVRSLADSIEASGRSWKTYAEGLPRRGFLGGSSGRYAKKHNPFAYFPSITANPQRVRRLAPFRELATDLAANRLPDFALVVPDLCNSTHDCAVSVGDAWLRRTVGPLLKLPRTAIFVTFDEGWSELRGGGHITTLAVGTAVRRGTAFRSITNHYGLLRTIEQAWGLPKLGRSATATPFTGIWR